MLFELLHLDEEARPGDDLERGVEVPRHVEDARHDEPSGHPGGKQEGRRLERDGNDGLQPPLAAEEGGEEHHRHDTEVLEDQDPKRGATVRAVHLASPGEEPEHDRRAAEGDEHPEEDAVGPGDADGAREHRRRGRGERHLEPAAHEQEAAHAGELADGELDADGEEQEDDAELGERLHLRRVPDHSEPERPAEHAGDQEADDRRQPHPVAEEYHGDAEGEKEREVGEEVRGVHRRGRPGGGTLRET